MNDGNEELIFNNAFRERVKDARDHKGWSQMVMADMLGVPFERYKKYENRSTLPIYLLERFSKLVDRDIQYLVTGKQQKLAGKPSLVVGNIKRTK